MTVLDTVVAISATVCASIMSIFFGYGGIKRRTLFVKLCKRKGVWWRQWAGICIFFILLTIYAQWLFGWSRSFINMLLLASYLVAITITDLRSREIPDDATAFYAVLFLLWNLASRDSSFILNGFLGAVIGAAIPFAIYFIRRDAIGLGDIKLLGCIGLLTGCPSILFVLLRAMVFGALFSVGLLFLKKGTLKTELPFAPFVLLAALI